MTYSIVVRDPLRPVYAVAQGRYLFVVETMATRANLQGMNDRREIDERITAIDADRATQGLTSASYSASFATPKS